MHTYGVVALHLPPAHLPATPLLLLLLQSMCLHHHMPDDVDLVVAEYNVSKRCAAGATGDKRKAGARLLRSSTASHVVPHSF